MSGVRLGGKAEVALTVEPHSKRIPVCDQEPLSYIKLSVMHKKRPLQVLLHHPLTVPHDAMVCIY